MGLLGILVAALAAFAFGAGWYGFLSERWKIASGVPLGDDGNPINAKSPVPYLTSLICILVISASMAYGFDLMGVTALGKGIVTGGGIGLFFITPWIFINNGYAARSQILSVIDGGYATFGCAIIGAVLVLM